MWKDIWQNMEVNKTLENSQPLIRYYLMLFVVLTNYANKLHCSFHMKERFYPNGRTYIQNQFELNCQTHSIFTGICNKLGCTRGLAQINKTIYRLNKYISLGYQNHRWFCDICHFAFSYDCHKKVSPRKLFCFPFSHYHIMAHS